MRAKLETLIREQIGSDVRPGEEIRTVAFAYNLPFPWWAGLMIFEYGLLLLISTPLYLGLTNERLIFRKFSRLSTKRTQPAFFYSPESVSVEKFRRGILWGKATLIAPDRKLRLKFNLHCRDEVEQSVNSLGRDPGEAVTPSGT